MAMSRELIKMTTNGLRYYHSHNTVYIVVAVTLGFVGWICALALEVLKYYTLVDLPTNKLQSRISGMICLRRKYLRVIFVTAAAIAVLSLFYKSAGFMEYWYTLMPFIIWYEVLNDYAVVIKLARLAASEVSVFKALVFVLVYGSLLGLLVASFSHRSILSWILICVGVFPIYPRKIVNIYTLFWLAICVITSIFPLLPTIVREGNYALVAIAGFLTATTSMIFTFFVAGKLKESIVLMIMVAVTVLCTFLRLHTVQSIHAKMGLPFLNQLLSWTLAVAVPACALLTDKRTIERLVVALLGLISVYILTCVSHEGLFMFVLTVNVLAWMKCEQLLSSTSIQTRPSILQTRDEHTPANKPLTFEEVRISFMFIFFILLAFFGTGNIASMNSFDPAAVCSFVTVFNPVLMATILCLKVMLPFLTVACSFSAMQNLLKINTRGLFYIVLIMTDIMSMIFFFLVKDEGSWQDIGTSISHFFIMLAFVIFLVPLFEVANLLTGSVSLERDKSHSN